MVETTEPAPTATLKFAAGTDRDGRRQQSSTWIMRLTRAPELYILNREAGGDLAHISLHRSGHAHAKFRTAPRTKQAVHEWSVQEPIDGTPVRRLAEVVIPHRGLVPPMPDQTPDPETVLIEPPMSGQQLVVTVFAEPGERPLGYWPGRSSMDSKFVGCLSVHADDDESLFYFTAVATYWPECDDAVRLSESRLDWPEGTAPPKAPRVVTFTPGTSSDGAFVPMLMEMPVGHMRAD